MRLNFDESMLELMTEGVMLLNRHVEVEYVNPVAGFWQRAILASQPALQRLIAEELDGQRNFPVSIDKLVNTGNPGMPVIQAWLCKNGKRGYAIFMLPPKLALASVQRPETFDKRYLELMGEQVCQQIAAFRDQLQAMGGNAGVAPALLDQSAALSSTLEEIANLAHLTQRDQVFAANRVDINHVILTALAQQAGPQAGRCIFTPGPQPQGVLYGDADWLTYALRVLIEGLLRGLLANFHVDITTRQMGDFIITTGKTVPGLVPRSKLAAQYLDALPYLTQPVQASAHAATRMLLCQRIVALHSGNLKIEFSSGAGLHGSEQSHGIDGFVLTLMSGLPEHERRRASCSDCRLTEQALVYAADIARLMGQITSPLTLPTTDQVDPHA